MLTGGDAGNGPNVRSSYVTVVGGARARMCGLTIAAAEFFRRSGVLDTWILRGWAARVYGRDGIPSVVHRLFEGLSFERGIAWRVADSLSLPSFLDLDVTEAAPDHSTLSRTRRMVDVETHVAVFTWFALEHRPPVTRLLHSSGGFRRRVEAVLARWSSTTVPGGRQSSQPGPPRSPRSLPAAPTTHDRAGSSAQRLRAPAV